MGTRAIIAFVDDSEEICTVYRQMDGYPTGLGADLKAILKDHRLVNGFGGADTWGNAFNGMGCLAASVVHHLKDSIGSIYINPPKTRDVGEVYVYTVSGSDSEILLEVAVAGGPVLYVGNVDAFDPEAAEQAKA